MTIENPQVVPDGVAPAVAVDEAYASSVDAVPDDEVPPETDVASEPSNTAASLLLPQEKPELVIGLVGPIGVDLNPTIEALSESLKVTGYSPIEIRLSSLISELAGVDFSDRPEHERIGGLMDLGTDLRELSKRGDAAAILAMAEIRKQRDLTGWPDKKGEATPAYILRSLKHPQEVDRLRTVYGAGFLLISVYAPREIRVTALAERILRSSKEKKNSRAFAESLVERDEAEEGRKLGQDVQDAFPLADFFIDARDTARVRQRMRRFLHLVFGDRFLTPTRDEYGMFQANAAAFRSADLNRQVGAAIVQNGSDLVTVGCNDVPKSGGDQYWEDDPGDARDFTRGIDSGAEQRVEMLEELMQRLHKADLLSSDATKDGVRSLVQDLLTGNKSKVLKGVGLVNLLEFGRSVHAEMAALMAAARLGRSVAGATLYCTTFPCHMCARHIVASGIKRVVYVEPYPKSRARQLHGDAVSVDATLESTAHVNFEPFEGLAPRIYQSMFAAHDQRKDENGRVKQFKMSKGNVRFQRYINTYQALETAFTAEVLPALKDIMRKNLKPINPPGETHGQAK